MWRWIILSSVLAQQILEITASLLNLCNLSPHLPLEFEDTFEPVKYAESQRYTKAKSWFGLLQSVFSTTAFIAFWFAGGFNALDQFTGSFGVSKSSAVVHGLIYIGMLSAMSTVISLPFSLYYDFVLERRFGFNKKTFLTFVKDLCLMTILVILLGGPLLALILYFFQATGSRAWIFCWSVTVAFSVFMVFITPKYILPLFNKLDPLPQDALKERIEKLASDLCFSFKGIFVMDGSKRSSHSNAFFTGFGSTKCIVLFDTLIEQQTHDEIISVLGHEIGHYKMRHIIWTMIFSILQQGLMFYVMQFFISSEDLADAFFMSNTSTHTGLIFFSQLFEPIGFVISVAMSYRSRVQEFEADRYAIDHVKDPESLISALKKLAKENLTNLTPHWLIVFMSYSHPPMLERIQAIRSYAANSLKK